MLLRCRKELCGTRLPWSWSAQRFFGSMLSGVSDDMLVSTSMGFAVRDNGSHDELVDNLAQCNIIKSKRIEDAFRAVDRAFFVPESLKYRAYENAPLPIGCGATISTAQHHAQVLELLNDTLAAGNSALDVGCGSGYVTAVMARLVGRKGRVHGIDIYPELVQFAKDNLLKMDARHQVVFEAGNAGELLKQEKYDSIHFGVAVSSFSEAENISKSLKSGGQLVIPVLEASGEQTLYRLSLRPKTGAIKTEPIMKVMCQAMLQARSITSKKIESKKEKVERLHHELLAWKEAYTQTHQRPPTRADIQADEHARTLFTQFASISKTWQ